MKTLFDTNPLSLPVLVKEPKLSMFMHNSEVLERTREAGSDGSAVKSNG